MTATAADQEGAATAGHAGPAGATPPARHEAPADPAPAAARGASRLRVLLLTAYPAIGGPLPKLAPLVADGLRAAGCDVVIERWSAHHAGHESPAAKVAGRTADLWRVHRRIREWRPDVVYVATAHNRTALLRDLPLAFTVRRGRPPLVLHLHGSECDRLGAPGARLFTVFSKALVRRAAAVMLLSTQEQRAWQAACPRVEFDVVVNPFVPASHAVRAAAPQAHVPGGAPAGEVAPAAAPVPTAVPCLFTVARLIPEKGVFDLLDALAIVCARRPCRLAIAGAGPARDELQRRIVDLGLSGSATLAGYLSGDALDDAYRGADLFVLPTYFAEGFPLSVMEAMSYGLPVVTTPIRGCADSLQAGENALFVPERDPVALAAAIERLLDDDGLRARMGRANAAKVAEFAPDRVLPRYAELLRDAVAAAVHTPRAQAADRR
jgi:glycosyltransferase involved in cell wall biosynthesis